MAGFVLVHGAFHGGWIWQRVARRLRAAGHEVLTPTLTGCGERFHLLSKAVSLATHVEDVVSAIVHEDLRDLILVGHSYGGMVNSMAAERLVDRVRRLVYLDGVAAIPGQAATGGFTRDTVAKLDELSDDDWLLQPLPFEACGVTDPQDIAWAAPRRHPHSLLVLNEPLRSTGAADSIPRSYIAHTDKAGMIALFGLDPLASFAERARRDGWRMGELFIGHDGMFTDPQLVADALLAELIQSSEPD